MSNGVGIGFYPPQPQTSPLPELCCWERLATAPHDELNGTGPQDESDGTQRGSGCFIKGCSSAVRLSRRLTVSKEEIELAINGAANLGRAQKASRVYEELAASYQDRFPVDQTI